MKNPFYYIIPKYYQKLDTIPGVTVYDGMAPSTASGTYIIIGDRQSNQLDDKSGFLSDLSVTIDCVVKGQGFGFKDSEELANSVLGLINSDAPFDDSPDFQVSCTRMESINNLSGLNPTDNIFRTIIRFSHKVSQL